MPWQNQGGGPWGGGGQGPWGRRGGSGGGGNQPPDLEELLRKSQDRMKQFIPGGGSGKGLVLIIAAAILVWLATGIYRVQPNEQGVVLLRSEEHTSELQSLMRISYAVFCLKKKKRSRTEKLQNSRLKNQKPTRC